MKPAVRKVASAVLSYGVVAVVMVFVFRSISNPSQLADALKSISAAEVIIVCALGLVYLASMFRPMVYALPGLTMGQAATARTASLALANTVPEGGTVATGLTFAMYRSWGFKLGDSTSSIVTIGIWTNLTRYTLMSLALVLLVIFGSPTASTVWITVGSCTVVAAIMALFAAILRSDRFARRIGRILTAVRGAIAEKIHRITPRDMEAVVSEFRSDLLVRVRTSWRALTATMVVSQLLGALVLGVAVRLAGLDSSDVSWDRIVIAFGAMWLASFIAPTPGGLGVAEAALIAVMGVGLAADLHADLVAAVLMFRLATWLLPIPLGLVAYLYWRSTKNWRVDRPLESNDLQTRSEDSGRS